SQFEFLDTDYKRQQQLALEKINSEKPLQEAKSKYFILLAQVKGLKARISMLGINTESLTAENLQSAVSLRSPISGYVTQVNASIGQYISPNEKLFEIVDTRHLHAELMVFEQDIP